MALNIVKMNYLANTTAAPNRDIKWLVVHYTAGKTSKAGTARSTATYFSKPSVQASADFIVDDAEIVQFNADPKNYYAWSVGGKKYSSMSTSQGGKYYGQCTNANSINVEMCSNKKNTATMSVSDTDWYLTEATINNTVELVKYLMDEYDIDIDHVIMHHHVTGKVCPQPWTLNEASLAQWNAFKNRLKPAASPAPAQPAAKPVATKPTSAASKSSFPATPFTVQVLISDLNYRSQPSMSGTVKGQTGKGNFTITEVKDGWGKLKSGAGWIYLENKSYVTVGKTVATATAKPASKDYKVQVTATALNIRKGPGTSYAKNGVIRDKGVYTIVETKNGWGRLKSGKGWISLSYTKRV